jgi:hypothetical protein
VIKQGGDGELLRPGQILASEFDGSPVTVGQFIAAFGQGAVYSANRGGEPAAIKWYKNDAISADPNLAKRLRRIRDRYPTAPCGAFLWPSDVVVAAGGFGYMMPLREKRFCDLDKALYADTPPNMRARSTAAFETVDAYQKLHAEGLCYTDINFGNVALDIETGETRICNCDCVGVNNEDPGIYLTVGFMAPELVDGVARPTRDTDLWSISVLLFRLFLVDHPLLGTRDPTGKDQTSFGRNAVFIWDPRDDSNHPLPGEYDQAEAYWNMYPQVLRDHFTRAFTAGIRDPGSRVKESEWCPLLARLRDSITQCRQCTAENFYEAEGQVCWHCQQALRAPAHLEFGARRIVMADGAAVYGSHLNPSNAAAAGKLIGRVVRHPDRPDLIGLENLTTAPWRVVLPNGDEATVVPNKRIRIEPGVRIDFGVIEGRVT